MDPMGTIFFGGGKVPRFAELIRVLGQWSNWDFEGWKELDSKVLIF